jgi:hypothetical protein
LRDFTKQIHIDTPEKTLRKPARLTGIVEPSYAGEDKLVLRLLNSPAEV